MQAVVFLVLCPARALALVAVVYLVKAVAAAQILVPFRVSTHSECTLFNEEHVINHVILNSFFTVCLLGAAILVQGKTNFDLHVIYHRPTKYMGGMDNMDLQQLWIWYS